MDLVCPVRDREWRPHEAAELGLWNRVVDDHRLQAEVDALIKVVLSKNQQAVRQLKLIIDKGAEAWRDHLTRSIARVLRVLPLDHGSP